MHGMIPKRNRSNRGCTQSKQVEESLDLDGGITARSVESGRTARLRDETPVPRMPTPRRSPGEPGSSPGTKHFKAAIVPEWPPLSHETKADVGNEPPTRVGTAALAVTCNWTSLLASFHEGPGVLQSDGSR
jgi:hypothetical protein